MSQSWVKCHFVLVKAQINMHSLRNESKSLNEGKY